MQQPIHIVSTVRCWLHFLGQSPFQRALAMYNKGKFEEAVELLNTLQDINAQSFIGFLYVQGKGVPKDVERGLVMLRQGEQLGNATAQCRLGTCYMNGISWGVEQDIGRALELYRLAADQGNPAAQYNLGLCYDNGTGVERDVGRAVELYRLAAEQGNAAAQNNLANRYKTGQRDTRLEKDVQWAVQLYQMAADGGNTSALCNLALCYEDGTGVEQDVGRAVELYRLAADQGHTTAQDHLRRLGQLSPVASLEVPSAASGSGQRLSSHFLVISRLTLFRGFTSTRPFRT